MEPDRKRAVIDTSLARRLGYSQDEAALRMLGALAGRGFSLHLADSAIVELTGQLWDGDFRWPEWLRAREHLRRLLDPREPILNGGIRLLANEGFLSDPAPELVRPSRGELRIETTEGWYRLCAATSPQEIASPRLAMIGGRVIFGMTDAKNAKTIIAEERAAWITSFAEFAGIVDGAGDRTRVRKAVSSEMESVQRQIDAKGKPGVPTLSARIDAAVRVMLRYYSLSLNPEHARYRPDSEKRKNDAIDFSMLVYLALPALVCAVDKKFVDAPRLAGSPQAKWVLGLDALAAIADGGIPPQLVW